jgi:glycosyltransferase involved in cell wall biosynthesis
VSSVRSQTYSNIECVIVDDASTDDSPAVLGEIERENPHFTIIRKSENAGQTAAFFTGFMASNGQFAVFLDADDLLLPDFVETHVFVHLSLGEPVGFPSADTLQTVGTRVATSSFWNMGRYVSEHRERVATLRRIDVVAPALWPTPCRRAERLERAVYMVPP